MQVVTARLGGQPVTVGVFADGPSRSYIAVDQGTCEQVATGSL